MAFCINCGKKLKDGVAFCMNCGCKASGKPTQTQPSQTVTSQTEGMQGNVYGMMPTNHIYEPEMAEVLRDIAVEKAKEANDRFQKWIPVARENIVDKYKNLKDRLVEESNRLAERKESGIMPDNNMARIRYCSQCGAQNSVEYKFCIQCGTSLEEILK